MGSDERFQDDTACGPAVVAAFHHDEMQEGAKTPDARQHEYGERGVDQGFVVHREELFGDTPGNRVKAGAGAAGQDDAFQLELLKD